jgi:hypothetical protein
MRTLQEKYNAIQEGKFSKDQFLVEARMQHPQIITRFNGYDDAVQILKNRGMISDVKIEEARLTKNNLTDYRFKPTNEMDKYPYEQILRGIRVELEAMEIHGTPTAEEYAKALAKVSKNLAKDSIFYTNQLAGVNPKVDLHDKMVDATAKNTVDTFNGMKKAELKEGFKKLIKKVLSEELTDVENYKEADMYEMYGPKTDAEYKRELENYLEDNQIYGYTDRLFDILTDPAEETVADKLADFLDDNQIYGYNKGLLAIFRDYANNNERQYIPDEDEIDEAADTEADKNMVRKLMAMYETEPSKFEKLHKQAQTQASTSKDIKFKHLLSLIDRAKAGALQSLANQDKYQASIEGMDEIATDITGFPKWRELGQDEKDRIGTFVKDTGDRDQAEYERARKERLAAQSAQLAKHIAGDKNLQEVRKAKSLSELLK